MSADSELTGVPVKTDQAMQVRIADDLSTEELELIVRQQSRPKERLDLASPFFDIRHPGLTRAQESALLELQGGGTFADAARAANVSRTTIYRWMSAGTKFRAVYDNWLDEVRQSAQSRLTALMYKAATAVRKSIEAGNAPISWQLLKHFGSLPKIGQILASGAPARSQKPSGCAPAAHKPAKPEVFAMEDQEGKEDT